MSQNVSLIAFGLLRPSDVGRLAALEESSGLLSSLSCTIRACAVPVTLIVPACPSGARRMIPVPPRPVAEPTSAQVPLCRS